MTNKELFKAAHKMAKEIKAQYPEVDYKFQFSLCLAFIKEKGEKEEMSELQGSPKQIKWANDIRAKQLAELDKMVGALEMANKYIAGKENKHKAFAELINGEKLPDEFFTLRDSADRYGIFETGAPYNDLVKLVEYRAQLLAETSAKKIIDTRYFV